MLADVNLQAWLETDAASHPPIVTPYVRSAEAGHIRYSVEASKHGPGGTSKLSQSGSVSVRAATATPLSHFSLSVGARDVCTITLSLTADGATTRTYHFDCPR